jgi:nucleotide-binding universal stress UspA family protein
MKTVLVALDNSPAGKPVVGAARALAALLGAEVAALHVRVDGSRTAQNMAESAAIPYRAVRGVAAERLIEAGVHEDVLAVVLGARGTRASRRPLGGTAASVATALAKPVLIVPPDANPAPTFRRVLVPVEGTLSTSLAPRVIFELVTGAEVDVVALHVHDLDSLPAFTDQPQHEQYAWAREFLLRYCPWGLGEVRLERRVGRIGDVVPLVAEQCDCDLIVLGWARALSEGRAPVVRETLARSRRPVLLVPVESTVADPPVAPSAGTSAAVTV